MGRNGSRRASRAARVARWTLFGSALILLATAGWIRFRFGPVSLEQVLLNTPAEGGEGAGNNSLVGEAAVVCLAAPLVVTVLLMLAARRFRSRPERWPARRALILATLAFTVSLGVLLEVAGVPEYAAALLGNRSIATYYVRPTAAPLPAKPRNLVTIYLESGEDSFADESLFGQNLLRDLDRATQGWARYDGLRQYPGGGWTMAGLVSTQCGIPLKSRLLTDGMNLNNFGEGVATYLPGATCLGDLLSDRGYTDVFLGGAHGRFAGKDTFLADHGYDEVVGLSEWEADGESRSEISVWGLSDHRLLAHAEQVVDRLHAGRKPFHLTLLTLDTHEPGGLFPSCPAAPDSDRMKAAVTCSMRAVAGFLDHLKAEGYLDDTVVVVMGDHLKATSEGGSFRTELEAKAERTIVLRVWSPDAFSFSRNTADQLSVLPTTLDLLGLGSPDGRAGLGVSFAGPHPTEGTAVGLPEADYRAVITSPSTEIYQRFWGEPE